MKATLVEIKARSNENDRLRVILKSRNADFKGVHHQIDTYFRVPEGRLKLREDQNQMELIFYRRADQVASKRSDVCLYRTGTDESLKATLTAAFGVLAVVDKQREISFIGNVKFHLDEVRGLGSFMEIEAIDETGRVGVEKLREQCEGYKELLGIADEDLLTGSYSDMVLETV